MAEGLSRPAWAEIDLDAARHNARVLTQLVKPASLCAVVKAHGYGHGAIPMARAAVAGGAVGLAVALVEEGVQLVEGKVSAPILLLSEPAPDAVDTAVAAGLTPTVYTPQMVNLFSQAGKDFGRPVQVHIKVDTGMHRVGADPKDVVALVEMIDNDHGLTLEGLWTHLAVADGAVAEDRDYTLEQLARFDEVVAAVKERHPAPLVLHAANSAGAMIYPEARYGMVRSGIALYGEAPCPAAADALETAVGEVLQPVLSLRARVSAIRQLPAGERLSYGRLRPLPADATVATVPIGYADGVPRALFAAGYEVLIGGRRRPLAGQVTMDQIVVDCGDDNSVAVGDEVVLLGRQGDEEITASEWATLLGTISYEVLCGIGPRVPRVIRAGMGAKTEVLVAPPSKITD
jgi:alanine racemase